MAGQTPNSPGWRANDGGSAGGGSAGGRGGQHWRKSAPVAAAGRSLFRSRFIKIPLSLLAVAACAYGIYWIWNFGSASSINFVLATVPEYVSESIPANPFATTDQGLQEKLLELNRRQQAVRFSTLNSFSDDPPPPARVREVLVLTVSLIAANNGKETAFLLRDADPDAPEKYLREEDLWNWLAKLEPRQPKLLLLDLARVRHDWRAGWFGQNVWAGIEARAAKIRGLVVMTACAPGEQSWTSRDLGSDGASTFLHYVVSGLYGAADQEVPGRRKDGLIKVSELYAYVAANTAHWVVNNRDPSGQHPQLIPSPNKLQDLDFTVCKALSGNGNPFSTRAPSATAEVENSIAAAWRQHERLRASSGVLAPWRSHPVLWRIATDDLLRAESSLDAGHPDRAAAVAKRVAGQLAAMQGATPASSTAFQKFPYLRDNVAARWPTEATDAGAAAVEQFRTLEDVLTRHLESSGSAAGDWPLPMNLPVDLIGKARALRSLTESAASPDPAAVRWVAPWLNPLEGEIRTLEDALFVGSPVAANDPRFETFTARLNDIRSLAQSVAAAEMILREARAKVPTLARWAAWREGNEASRETILRVAAESSQTFAADRPASLMETWETQAQSLQGLDAVEALAAALAGWTAKLQFLLSEKGREQLLAANSPTAAAQPLDDAAAHLRQLLDTIEAKLQTEEAELLRLDPESPQPVHRQRLVELLRHPGIATESRLQLRQKLRFIEQKMHERTEGVAPSAAAQKQPEDARRAADLASARWHTFWVLLLPAGDEFLNRELTEAWTSLALNDDPQSGERLASDLAGKIAKAWPARRRYVEDQLSRPSDFIARRSLIQEAERSAVWLDSRDSWPMLETTHEPSALLSSFDLVELSLLHAGRQLDGFWKDRGEAREAMPWYAAAVSQCLAFANQESRSAAIDAKMEIDVHTARLRAVQESLLQLSSTQTEPLRFGLTSNRQEVTAQVTQQGQLPAGAAALWMQLTETPALKLLENGLAADVARQSSVPFVLEKDISVVGADVCKPVSGKMYAFFRGHVFSDREVLKIEPCRETGRITRYLPAPATGSLVVTGKDDRPIVFVFDCSLSMNDKVPGTQDSKFNVALRGFRTLLSSPAFWDLEAGLVFFGHRAANAGTGKPANLNPRWIENVGPIPAGLGYLEDYEPRVPVTPFLQARVLIEDQLKLLQDKTKAHGNTPLFGAIVEAMSEKMLTSKGGVVVVITDGDADDGPGDGNRSRFSDLKERISKIPTKVIIVGFGFAKKTDFNILAQDFKDLPNVSVLEAPTEETLISSVSGALEPRPYSLFKADSTIPLAESDLGSPVNRMATGRYTVTFPEFPPVNFAIAGGEKLALDLDYGLRQMRIKTPTYKLRQYVPQDVISAPDDPRLMAYESYTVDKEGTATLLVVLDREQPEGNSGPTTLVRRPEQVDFDVRPVGGSWTGDYEWRLLENQTVPTWQLVLHKYDSQQPLELRGWWRGERLAPEAMIPWEKLQPTTPERPVGVELPQGGGTLSMYRASPRPSSLQLAITLSQQTPISEAQLELFGRLDIQLGTVDVNGRFVPQDVEIRRDFGKEDTSLLVDFDVTGVDLDRSVVAFTSIAAIREGALTTPPIVIRQPDAVGVAP